MRVSGPCQRCGTPHDFAVPASLSGPRRNTGGRWVRLVWVRDTSNRAAGRAIQYLTVYCMACWKKEDMPVRIYIHPDRTATVTTKFGNERISTDGHP